MELSTQHYIEAVKKYCDSINAVNADELLQKANKIFTDLNLGSNKKIAEEVFNKIAKIENPHAQLWAATHFIEKGIDRERGRHILEELKHKGGVASVMADVILKAQAKRGEK